MFIWTAKLTRKRAILWVVLAGLCAALLIVGVGLWQSRGAGDADGRAVDGITDNAARVAFLMSYGWEVQPEPVETLRLLLPEDLDETWKAYNALQKDQGFDLTPYCGKRVERFTYNVGNYPGAAEAVQANLYLCGETVVAGDIFCAGTDGFQTTLAFPETARGKTD